MTNPDYGRTVKVELGKLAGETHHWKGRFLQFGQTVEEGVDPPLVWTVALVEDSEGNVKEVEMHKFRFTDPPPTPPYYLHKQ